jgi:hypothetical protein
LDKPSTTASNLPDSTTDPLAASHILGPSYKPCTTATNFPDLTMDAPAASHTPGPSHEPRHFDRERAPLAHLHDDHYFSVLVTLHQPHSYREASSDPFWQKAMSDELDALSKNPYMGLGGFASWEVCSGFIKLRIVQMNPWNTIRLVLL